MVLPASPWACPTLTPPAPTTPTRTHPLGRGQFGSADAGEQLTIVAAPRRRLEELVLAADDPDDLDRIAAALRRLEVPFVRDAQVLRAVDPGTEVTVTVEPRAGARAPGVLREGTPSRWLRPSRTSQPKPGS